MNTAPSVARSAMTAGLLACAIAGSALFVVTVLVQSVTRVGFDPRVHALSMLALGDLGWVQTTNFILSGALILVSVAGFHRALSPGRGRTWGPILIGLFGIGLIWGGLFPTDAGLGFPDGAPSGMTEPTLVGTLHNLSPTLIAVSLVAACIVLARRFAGEKRWGWTAYCIATPVAYLVLGFAAFPLGDFRWVLAGGAIIWTWPAVVAAGLLREVRSGSRAEPEPSHRGAAA
ncbi:DUF998 domain-containing protein [Microbacterium sp. HD4P20]|uniref:DUF998 domain-containing protein n=1 Tax=Microbacterium sp. HD4P20 TaxID=2864874 RepID=UPI001C6435B3|nr:DUF998 domain-containing protein [Microbacterium sp. HD4P20]MCP2637442.1 DUF998 domain-containing protein [Microbacterium sp. HD4P20]